MFLGIDDSAGLVYESVGANPDRPVMPIPMVSQAKIIAQRSDWEALPGSFRASPITWLFREDSFDPVTRTRRVRLYQAMTGASYPNHQARVMPYPFEDLTRSQLGPDGRLHRPLSVYAAATNLFDFPNRGLGLMTVLIFMNRPFSSEVMRAERDRWCVKHIRRSSEFLGQFQTMNADVNSGCRAGVGSLSQPDSSRRLA